MIDTREILIELLGKSDNIKKQMINMELNLGSMFFETIFDEKECSLKIRLLSYDEIKKEGMTNKMVVKQ
jgi:hypothetical protein